MNKKLNIFWILVDSARNFKTNEDERGIPNSIEEFGMKSIFLKNTVCSAPSTIMSVSSMMTSNPSYNLSRNYDNFPNIKNNFTTLSDILKDHNYETQGEIS